ncbi:nuclear transport factor 2 family protein [Novosphingobium sp. G106]|uniref:nuclear transport factor 2 family protein n=1 Tax=Novosphingobium sp. G106 TaxID=2849500 RepID=UPI001C2D6B54|nr:nuclear transport factor 2 family protein [Novosphingobium sp. G106]MBV1686788.1 nuclear transport factor 2 family protein [Novosphingobium sp. G106]
MKTPLEIATAWMEAAARCDIEAIAAGMADDCRRFGEPSWMVIAKPDYIAAYRQYLMSFSDYRLEIVNVMASGRTVVFEMIESARFSSPYPLSDGNAIQPNGKSYTDHVCTWIEVDSAGLIAEIRAYIPSTRGALMADAMGASA